MRENKVVKLKDVISTKIQNGYSPLCQEDSSGVWVLSLGALTGYSFDSSQIKAVSSSEKMPEEYRLKDNDILVSRSNTLDKVGRCGVFHGEIDNCFYPDLMMRFRADEKIVLTKYLETVLQSEFARKYFQERAAGTSVSMMKINKKILEDFSFSLPSLKEQEKIIKITLVWDSAIEKTIVPLIDNAKHYIYMSVFLITDKRLAAALINAKNRGVEIKVIVDATNAKAKYSKHRLLRQHGIKVKTENYAGKLHSKSMIIDDTYTVIGSMNFSGSGEKKNDENLIVVKNSELAKHYKKFFEYLWVKIPDFWLTHDVSAESIYSIGSCSDGIDNDYDGLIDSADEGCRIKFKKKYSKH